MTQHVLICDPNKHERCAKLDPDGNLQVIAAPMPPGGTMQRMRAFRQHLTDDGLATDGTNQDMAVDGSSTNVDFYVGASQTDDRYLSMVSFVIADANSVMNEFGNIGALTNGCRFFYEDERGEVEIHEGLKTNFQFVRLCHGQPGFGNTTNAFRVSNVTGTSEAVFQSLDLRNTFGFQWGLRLRAGSVQRLTMTVRDNCSGVDQFDAIAYGFERTLD